MERTVSRADGRVVIDLASIGEVDLELVGGEAMVAGTSDPARVEIECLAGPPVQVRVDDGRLSVRHQVEVPFLRHPSPAAVVVVSCAPTARVRTQSVSAATVVAGLAAPVTTATVSGRMTWSYLTGDLRVQTVSGAVEMEGVVGSLDVNTVSGSVGVAGGCLTRMGITSASGDVTVELEPRHSGDYRCRTVSGDVAVVLPPATDLTVKASSLSGVVTLPEQPAPRRVRRPWQARSAVLGSGEGSLQLSTVSGGLAVVVREGAVTV